ncbi:MAG: NIF family HAD-type phosphatase [Saprospiraceae bacterium]
MNEIDPSNIKVILLDLGGVVFQYSSESNEKIRWDIIHLLKDKYGNELNVGTARLTKILSEYSHLTNQYLGEREFLSGIFNTLYFNKDLIKTLKTNYKIIIVSDNNEENISYISERYDFAKWAIDQIYSFDYQMVKSDKNFFKRLVVEVGFEKEEMVLIDNQQRNIDSASACGIAGILYRGNEETNHILAH